MFRKNIDSSVLVVLCLSIATTMTTTQAYTGFTSTVFATSGMLSNFTIASNPLTRIANLNSANPKFFTSQLLSAGASIIGVNGAGFLSAGNIFLLDDAVAQVYVVNQKLAVANFFSLQDGSFQTQVTIYSGASIFLTIPKIYSKGNLLVVAHKADSVSTNLYISTITYNPASPSASTISTSFLTANYTGPISIVLDELNNVAVSYKTSTGTYVSAYGSVATVTNVPTTSPKHVLTAFNQTWTLFVYTTSVIYAATESSLVMAATSTSPPPTGFSVVGSSSDRKQLYYLDIVSGTTTVYDSQGVTVLSTTDSVNYFDGQNGILINTLEFTLLTSV